jgi:hypothetical protein
MTFEDSNRFFSKHVYPEIWNFGFLPVKLLNLVVDPNKKISDYNAADIVKSLIVGAFLVLPLTMVTLDIALDMLSIALIAHIASAFVCLLADAGKKMAESADNHHSHART